MKKAISYLYREILLKVNEELDRLYDSPYDEDLESKAYIELFRLRYKALNLDDVQNFDDTKVEEFYDEIKYEEFEDYVRDVVSEFRDSGENIDDKVYEDRYYCYRDVAILITGRDDLYLAWTYYFGGGKHAQPWDVEWMEDCYLLTCKEVVETRIVKVYLPLVDDNEKVEDK